MRKRREMGHSERVCCTSCTIERGAPNERTRRRTDEPGESKGRRYGVRECVLRDNTFRGRVEVMKMEME